MRSSMILVLFWPNEEVTLRRAGFLLNSCLTEQQCASQTRAATAGRGGEFRVCLEFRRTVVLTVCVSFPARGPLRWNEGLKWGTNGSPFLSWGRKQEGAYSGALR